MHMCTHNILYTQHYTLSHLACSTSTLKMFLQSIEQSQQLVSSSKKKQVPRKHYQPERSKTSTANPVELFRPEARRRIKHHHRPEDLVLLETELKQENYCEKFHQLLCREEEEHEKLLSDR